MPKRVVVIGGGISGLSAAHRIHELGRDKKLDLEVVLLEKSDRLGGVISTVEKDGFIIEEGPDSFITTKPWGLNLCSRLGLEGELIETSEDKRRTFILRDGKLVPLPDGFIMLAPTRIIPFLKTPLFSWRGKIRILMDLVIPKETHEDESLSSFVRRRLGAEALERAAQPMISGIYTADPRKLSLRSTMPQFLEMEERYGSVLKGMYHAYRNRDKRIAADSGARYSMFVSFKRGMNTLVQALTNALREEEIRTGVTVREIKEGPEGWEVITDDGPINASGVIVTTPSYVTARLLENSAGQCSNLLSQIEYASSAVIISAYRRDEMGNMPDGFGFVVPIIEKSSIIACSFSSEKFSGRAPAGYTIIRAFIGGAVDPDRYMMGDGSIIDTVEKELSPILGIKSKPVFTHIRRYPEAMPQYHVGHMELAGRIEGEIKKLRGLEVAGNAFGGVGIPDCIYSGERASERLLESLFEGHF